jgi:hypothetical protein
MAGTPAGCMATPGDPGPGRTPARDHPAGPGPGNVAVEQSCAVSVAGAQEGAAARRIRSNPAVTLSDMGGREERSPSRLIVRLGTPGNMIHEMDRSG